MGHEGHISRSLLAIMESKGVVQQDEDKRWTLRSHPGPDDPLSGGSY